MLPPIKRPRGRPKLNRATPQSSPAELAAVPALTIKPRPGPKLPRDPVRRFLALAGYRYTYGTLPDMKTRVPNQAARHLEIKQRTIATLVALGAEGDTFGPHSRNLQTAALRDGSLYRSMGALRELNLRALAHIGTIRDALHEIERELWITLELAHDPELAPLAPTTKAVRTIKGKTRAAVAAGAEPPKNKPCVYMPTHIAPPPGDELHLATDLASEILPPAAVARVRDYKMTPARLERSPTCRRNYEVSPEEKLKRRAAMLELRAKKRASQPPQSQSDDT